MNRSSPKLKGLARAIRQDDEAAVEAAIVELSRSRRAFAPLAFLLGALMMLLRGLRLVISDWRLLLLQIVPAMWIWAGMLVFKQHVFRGRQFRDWHGTVALLTMVGIALVTIVSYYLNVVFAFAIADPGDGRFGRARIRAGQHWGEIAYRGLVVGTALAVSVVVVPRWGRFWFALSLGVVLAVMMVSFVAFPARLIGVSSKAPRRDKLAATAVSGAVGAAICTPAYVLGRTGVLLLGSKNLLFVLGAIMMCVGFSLQAGANGAIKAIKMSVKLVVGDIKQPPPPRTVPPRAGTGAVAATPDGV